MTPRRGAAPRLYVAAVVAAGAGIFALALLHLLDSPVPGQLWPFVLLTVVSGLFTLKIPTIESTLSLSELFALTCALLFGPAAGVVPLVLDGLVLSVRRRTSVAQAAFNVGTLSISMWAAGNVFVWLSDAGPLYSHPHIGVAMTVPLVAMGLTYFALHSGLTSLAVALHARRSAYALWRAHFASLAPSYLVAVSISMLLVVTFREVHFTAIALIVPLLLISYVAVRRSFGRLEAARTHVSDLNRLLFSAVETLATAIDAKDEATRNHVRRVQQGTLALARELGVADQRTLMALEAAALLHDAGKVVVPEHILNKPGKLTPAEFERMKQHAPIGADILSSIQFPYPVAPIVRHHHENWDGSGYPDGLAGTAIPLGARILSVVDCFDALTSDRPYRPRLTDEQALAIVRERRGTMYDPIVVDTFTSACDRIMPPTADTLHPAARVIGAARAADGDDRADADPLRPDAGAPVHVTEGLLALTSLSRALGGNARVSDVGALLWMIVQQVLPCDAMAIFLPDEDCDQIVAAYAAGHQAGALRKIVRAPGSGIAGWVAVNGRPAVNSDPALDLGPAMGSPALRSCLALPLVESEALIAVFAVYSTQPGAFSEDHERLLELLSPRLTTSLLDAVLAEEQEASTPAAPVAPTLRLVSGNNA